MFDYQSLSRGESVFFQYNFSSLALLLQIIKPSFAFFCVFFFQLNDKSGPTLTTTVAMPVFSTKNETVSQL